MFKKLPFISILLLFLVGLGGCGGDDSTTAASLSKSEYIKRAKVICTDAESEQFKQGSLYLEKHPGVEEEQVLVEAALPPLEKELQKLKALGTPSGGASQVDAYLLAFEKALKETREDPKNALSASSNPFERPNKLAEAYGLEGCSGNP